MVVSSTNPPMARNGNMAASIAWDRQNPQFHHHYHYGSQYPGSFPIYNNLYSMSRNGYKVAGIYVATQCIIFLCCCSIFLIVMGAVMTGLAASIDADSGGTTHPQNNPLKVAGPITITMAIALLIASSLLCVCAYREGMKVANATRPVPPIGETVTRSTHAYGEPGNPANNRRHPPPAGFNLPANANSDRIGSSEIAYIAPLPPPYAHPPIITANIYPASDGYSTNAGRNPFGNNIGSPTDDGMPFFASIPESRLCTPSKQTVSVRNGNSRASQGEQGSVSLPGVPLPPSLDDSIEQDRNDVPNNTAQTSNGNSSDRF